MISEEVGSMCSKVEYDELLPLNIREEILKRIKDNTLKKKEGVAKTH